MLSLGPRTPALAHFAIYDPSSESFLSNFFGNLTPDSPWKLDKD